MYWFWRGTIAVAFTTILVTFVVRAFWPINVVMRNAVGRPLAAVAVVVLAAVLAIVLYHYLTRSYGPGAALERETRCRKCRYILRGISEPRCPECGEKI